MIQRWGRRKAVSVITACSTLLVVLGSASLGNTATTSVVTSKDAYVSSMTQWRDTNFGSSKELRADPAHPERRSYLSFSMASVPSNASSASLQLTPISGSSGFTVNTTSAFDENTITYNNAPVSTGVVGKATSISSSTVSVNITSAVLAAKQAGASELNLELVGTGDLDRFNSREASSGKPSLSITVPDVTSTSSSTTIAQSTTTVPSSTNGAIRAAFVYPWYGPNGAGWYSNQHYTPSLGLYDSADPSVISAQLSMMNYAGINTAISSWWGQGDRTDNNLKLMMNAASGSSTTFSAYYEQEGNAFGNGPNPSSSSINNDLQYLAQYAASPQWLKVGGKPVLFVYGDSTDGCATLDRWNAAPLSADWHIVQKVFSGYTSCANSSKFDFHQYGPATSIDVQPGYSVSISPGFFKFGESTPRLARDPATFTSAVQQMVASTNKWHLITTFNEWGEGTSVEPSVEFGNTYLDILHNNPERGGVVTPPTTTTTTLPLTTTTGFVTSTTKPSTTTTTAGPVSTTSSTTLPANGSVCGSATAPATYKHVVVIAEENRTWTGGATPAVGMGFDATKMPFLHSMASQCAYYANWIETNTSQNSLTQYVGLTSGYNNTATVNDCSPSTTCRSTDDNIFRQVRLSGGTARNYVDGATSTCSASGNAPKHVPDLYYYGTYTDASGTHSDHDFCSTEVVPFSTFNVNALPTYSFVSPNLCNDGHDCSDTTVDNWAKPLIQRITSSASYASGDTAIVVIYDEDKPVPNLIIAPSVHGGQINGTTGTHAALLRTTDEMLGLPLLASVVSQISLRASSGL